MDKELSKLIETIKRDAVDVIPESSLLEKAACSVKENKPLRLKIGFDPTAKDIHLGHTVLLRKLRKLQDLGHQVVLIIGDFTAKIGDPSGRTVLRPVLTDSQIAQNAQTYTDQTFKILDIKRTEIINNSVWYKDMAVSDFLSLLSSYTLARILERDDFSQRFKEKKPLTMLELVYPLIQGYDSVMCKADIEFGGTDQKFNLLVGRTLQEVFHQPPQAIVTMPILVGLDGVNKMSKSLGNYISVTEDPKDMFGKLMSVSDEVMWDYFRLLTEEDIPSLQKIHPKAAKLHLSKTIVSQYYSPEVAGLKQQEFERVFSERKVPSDLLEVRVGSEQGDIVELLAKSGLAASKNEARRLLNQGSISLVESGDCLNSIIIDSPVINIPSQGVIFKVGKKRFVRFKP
ncbi:MAG: tyrosine--tRNA ligase [Candidatus Omnitrophica bacterium]|nr:tyrosine--tRNA ligase [Candidatus Omnitrophota bacterium]